MANKPKTISRTARSDKALRPVNADRQGKSEARDRFGKATSELQVETVAGDFQMDWLLKVRAVVARCGEMDAGQWWNTKGQLGEYGAKVLKRGLPRTHYFAQARSVFAVAAHRCDEIFSPLGGATLWRLTDKIEDEFDRKWESFLDEAESWNPFFEELAKRANPQVKDSLLHFGLVSDEVIEESAKHLKKSVDGRALRATGTLSCGRRTISLLALGFDRAAVGKLVVPYATIAIDLHRPNKGEPPPPDALEDA